MIILENFHYIHIELTSRILEILNEFLWNTREAINLILEAINFFKEVNKCDIRFGPFLKILKESGNLIFIENVIIFLNSLINSCESIDERLSLKSELIDCGILNIFEV